MVPPAWLLEQHGTLEEALLAADLRVINAEADVGAAIQLARAAMDRKIAAEEEFRALARAEMEARDRLRNIRQHRDWVERLLCYEADNRERI